MITPEAPTLPLEPTGKEAIYNRSKKGRKKSKVTDASEVTARPEDCIRVAPLRDDSAAQPESLPLELSSKDKSAQLQLSEDKHSVTGWKGFRTVRATRGVHVGTWYCEVKVTHLGTSGHCRLGWATKKAEIQAPVGFDVFGFSYRDVDGSKVHKSWRDSYGTGYGEGDVIGLYIHLPSGGRPMEQHVKAPVRFKGAMYYIEEPEPTPNALEGSIVGFTKNGEWQGSAFTNIDEGTYYPAASLYTLPDQSEGATVTFNFGPDFQFPPPAVDGCPAAKPFVEAVPVTVPDAPVPDATADPGAEIEDAAAVGAAAGAAAGDATLEGHVVVGDAAEVEQMDADGTADGGGEADPME